MFLTNSATEQQHMVDRDLMAECRFHFPEHSIPSMSTLSAFCSPDILSCTAYLSELEVSLRKDFMERK